MTDSVISQSASPVSDETLKELWIKVAVVLIFTPIVALLVAIAAALGNGEDFGNDDWAYIAWVAGSYVASIVAVLMADRQIYRYYDSRNQRGWAYPLLSAADKLLNRLQISGVQLDALLVPILPIIVVAVLSLQPYHLETPDGQARVMEDGRVFYAGDVVEAPRYWATSTLVPLNYNPSRGFSSDRHRHVLVPVDTAEGRVTMSMLVTMTLAESDDLTRILQSLDREYLESHEDDFLDDRVENYLARSAAPIVHDLQEGRMVPDYTVRLTQALDDHDGRPAWIGHIRVSDVSVVSGETGLTQ